MKYVAAMLLFISSFGVDANSSFSSVKVDRLEINNDSIHIIFSNAFTNSEGCGASQLVQDVVLKSDHLLRSEIYSQALAAFVSQSYVSGWVNGCTSLNGNQKAVLWRLDIHKN